MPACSMMMAEPSTTSSAAAVITCPGARPGQHAKTTGSGGRGRPARSPLMEPIATPVERSPCQRSGPAAAVPGASSGTSARIGTTAMSWNSSTAKVRWPYAFAAFRARQDLQRDRGGRQRKRDAQQGRGPHREPQRHAGERDQRAGDEELRGPEPEDVAPHGQQLDGFSSSPITNRQHHDATSATPRNESASLNNRPAGRSPRRPPDSRITAPSPSRLKIGTASTALRQKDQDGRNEARRSVCFRHESGPERGMRGS